MSSFCRDVDEISALLGCYTACSGNTLPKFRDNKLVQNSRVEKSIKKAKMKISFRIP
jgi:hypothetical protein